MKFNFFGTWQPPPSLPLPPDAVGLVNKSFHTAFRSLPGECVRASQGPFPGCQSPVHHPSARPSTRPPVRPSVRLPVRPSVRPIVRPSTRPSVHPSVRPSVRLAVCLFLSVCPSICFSRLSLCPSIHPPYLLPLCRSAFISIFVSIPFFSSVRPTLSVDHKYFSRSLFFGRWSFFKRPFPHTMFPFLTHPAGEDFDIFSENKRSIVPSYPIHYLKYAESKRIYSSVFIIILTE